jgi:hypothetical protein
VRYRSAHIGKEVSKHVMVAAILIGISRWLGTWIAGAFG